MWGGSTRREQKCGAEMRSPQHLPTRSGAAQGWHPSAAVPPCVHSRHTPAAHLEPARTRAWHRRRVAAPAAAAAPCHEAAAGDGLLLARAHGLNFPHSSGLFEFGGQELEADEVVRMLAPMMTTERIARIEGVVRRRTYGVTFVAEHLYDVGNLAAVCRSADAFGFGSVHVIKRSDDKYKLSARTSAGADKWLDVQAWDSTQRCTSAIKEAGMQLIVTHLSKSARAIQDVDFTRPTAVVFGNETFGASEEMVAAAGLDNCAIIPMAGFVESFNISVAASLVMFEAQQQRRRHQQRLRQEQQQQQQQQLQGGGDTPAAPAPGITPPPDGDLDTEQRLALKAALMLRSVREPATVIRELLAREPPQWQANRIRRAERRRAAAAAAHDELQLRAAPPASATAA